MDQGWVEWVQIALNVLVIAGAVTFVVHLRRLTTLWKDRFVVQGERIVKLEGELKKLSTWVAELATAGDRLADRVRKQELRP